MTMKLDRHEAFETKIYDEAPEADMNILLSSVNALSALFTCLFNPFNVRCSPFMGRQTTSSYVHIDIPYPSSCASSASPSQYNSLKLMGAGGWLVQPITGQEAVDMFRQESQAQRRFCPLRALFVPTAVLFLCITSRSCQNAREPNVRQDTCLIIVALWFILVSEAIICSWSFVKTARLPLSGMDSAIAHLRRLEDSRASKWSG